MIRDTVVVIAGRKALVAAAHAATFRKKQDLVLRAQRLQALAAVNTGLDSAVELNKVIRSIQAVNRKMKRESMFAEFV